MKSSRIYLKLMEKRDIPFKVKWSNDEDVKKTLFISNISEVGTEQWLNKAASDGSRRDFMIFDKHSNKPIGFAGVVKIDYINSKAETYLCIGEKEYWGKGFGSEAKVILLRYCFKELGLNRVYSYNWRSNQAMVEINKKLGFTLEGTLRQDFFANGELNDRYIFSMLRSEYFELYKD